LKSVAETALYDAYKKTYVPTVLQKDPDTKTAWKAIAEGVYV